MGQTEEAFQYRHGWSGPSLQVPCIHTPSNLHVLIKSQQLRHNEDTAMATLSGWRHDMQRLWTLSQGPKPDAPRQPETWSPNIASRPTAATRSRDDCFGQQEKFITLGIGEAAWRSYLCHRHDIERHMPWRRSLQRYRRSRWMQRMPGIQQQSQ
jgi:hypothetical protein